MRSGVASRRGSVSARVNRAATKAVDLRHDGSLFCGWSASKLTYASCAARWGVPAAGSLPHGPGQGSVTPLTLRAVAACLPDVAFSSAPASAGLMFVLDVPLARQAPALAEARGCVRCAPSTSQPRGASLRPRAWRKSRGDDELSGATRESTRTQFQRGQGGTEASSSAQPPQRQASGLPARCPLTSVL